VLLDLLEGLPLLLVVAVVVEPLLDRGGEVPLGQGRRPRDQVAPEVDRQQGEREDGDTGRRERDADDAAHEDGDDDVDDGTGNAAVRAGVRRLAKTVEDGECRVGHTRRWRGIVKTGGARLAKCGCGRTTAVQTPKALATFRHRQTRFARLSSTRSLRSRVSRDPRCARSLRSRACGVRVPGTSLALSSARI
jgi:hypothetical protein